MDKHKLFLLPVTDTLWDMLTMLSTFFEFMVLLGVVFLILVEFFEWAEKLFLGIRLIIKNIWPKR
jgi:hypothetical protein